MKNIFAHYPHQHEKKYAEYARKYTMQYAKKMINHAHHKSRHYFTQEFLDIIINHIMFIIFTQNRLYNESF